MTLMPLNILLVGVMALFGVGLYGLLTARNLIKIVMVLQILAKAAVISLVLAGKSSGNPGLGQSIAVTVIVVDTIAVVLGLALAIQIRRHFGTLDVQKVSSLKG
jgi:NADH:ubiquinone oxidoreductase subunit K